MLINSKKNLKQWKGVVNIQFYNGIDYFDMSKTWLLVKDSSFNVESDKTINFQEGTELNILTISSNGEHGFALVELNEHKIKLSLDELYDIIIQ